MAFGGGRHSGQFYALQRAILATQPGQAGQEVFAPVAHRFISHVAEMDDGKEPRFLHGVVFGKAAISIVAPNGVLECLGQVPPT